MTTLEATLGMPATICYLTDRQACTVIFVSKNGGKIIVRQDTATRTDSNGMSESQSYDYSPDPAGREHTFYRNSDGGYGKRGMYLQLGTRRTYYDYSF